MSYGVSRLWSALFLVLVLAVAFGYSSSPAQTEQRYRTTRHFSFSPTCDFSGVRVPSQPEWARGGNGHSQIASPCFESFAARARFLTNGGIGGSTSQYDQDVPKNSCWKQAGIYGAEFAAAGVGSCLSAYLGFRVWLNYAGMEFNWRGFLPGEAAFVASSTLLSSLLTDKVGNAFGRTGLWPLSAVGAAIGALGGALTFWSYWSNLDYSRRGFLIPVSLLLPAVGAVVGYNWGEGSKR